MSPSVIVKTLYRVEIIDSFTGKASFAYIDPADVSSLVPETIDIGEEYPSSTEVTGTNVLMKGGETYFVPLPVDKVGDVLNLWLEEQKVNA